MRTLFCSIPLLVLSSYDSTYKNVQAFSHSHDVTHISPTATRPSLATRSYRPLFAAASEWNISGNEHGQFSLVPPFSRRAFMVSASAVSLASILPVRGASASLDDTSSSVRPKVLVLGGSGLVGSEIVRQLKSNNDVDVIATSRNGRDGTIALDVTRPGMDVAVEVAQLAKGCLAVISTIGAIPLSDVPAENIKLVNAASGLAAIGAKAAGVKHFVFIANAPEVKTLMKENPGNLLSFMQPYLEGKTLSEEMIQKNFGNGGEGVSFTVVKPTFIYGGDKFGVSPPRVNSTYGKLVESLLSLGPFRAAANILPGVAGIALEPPVSAEAVARATIVGAFSNKSLVFDTHDAIVNAATAN